MTRDEKLRAMAVEWRKWADRMNHPVVRQCALELETILAEPETDPVIERFMAGPRPKVVAGWLGDCECTEVVGSDGSMWRQSGSSWQRIPGPFDEEPTP